MGLLQSEEQASVRVLPGASGLCDQCGWIAGQGSPPWVPYDPLGQPPPYGPLWLGPLSPCLPYGPYGLAPIGPLWLGSCGPYGLAPYNLQWLEPWPLWPLWLGLMRENTTY